MKKCTKSWKGDPVPYHRPTNKVKNGGDLIVHKERKGGVV